MLDLADLKKHNHNLPVGKLGIIRLLCPDKCLVHLFGFFYYEYRYFTWGGYVWRQKCRYQVNVKGHKTL